MQRAPKSVIHINFLPTDLIFDARPIWTALRVAEEDGRFPVGHFASTSAALGEAAIHMATRDYIMRAAVRELKDGVAALANRVPLTMSVDETRQPRLLRGIDIDPIRDRTLLAVDSFLFEFRAFLELMATFCYGILKRIGKEPGAKQTLSTGKTVTLKRSGNDLKTNAFLFFLCDKLKVTIDWYEFLSKHRNFFTHNGAPYCAIEDRLMFPPEYDMLIMRTNITDFDNATSDEYFRLSDCSKILAGIRQLGAAVQQHLIEQIGI